MDKLLEGFDLPQLNQEKKKKKTEKMSRAIANSETKIVILKLLTNKSLRPDSFQANSIEHLNKN